MPPGAVNPFNGEVHRVRAMETAKLAAELVARGARKDRRVSRCRVRRCSATPTGVTSSSAGSVAKAIGGNPAIMGRATKYPAEPAGDGVRPARVMGNLTDGRDGDAQDRLFHAITLLARGP